MLAITGITPGLSFDGGIVKRYRTAPVQSRTATLTPAGLRPAWPAVAGLGPPNGSRAGSTKTEAVPVNHTKLSRGLATGVEGVPLNGFVTAGCIGSVRERNPKPTPRTTTRAATV